MIFMGFLVAIIIAIAVMVMTQFSKEENADQGYRKENDINQKEESPSEKLKEENIVIKNPLDEETKTTLPNQKLETEKKETNSATYTILETEIVDMMRTFAFADVESKVYSYKQEFQWDEEQGKKIDSLVRDASALSNLYIAGKVEGEATGEGVLNIMNSLENPESVLMTTLALQKKEQKQVILAEISLLPTADIFDYKYVSTTEHDGEMLTEVKKIYTDIQQLHEISFKYDGTPLLAYVMEFPDKSLRLHSIQNTEAGSPYFTIAEWNLMEKNTKEGKPAFEGIDLTSRQ